MNEFGMHFHHLGLAVRRPEAAFHYLKSLGYSDGAAFFDPLQQVNLAMRYHAVMPAVEVIWPGDGPSPIDSMIKRGSGAMIYHLCYMSNDVEATVNAIDAAGLEIMPLGSAKPAVLFGGLEVSFYSITNVGIVELIQGEPEPFKAAEKNS